LALEPVCLEPGAARQALLPVEAGSHSVLAPELRVMVQPQAASQICRPGAPCLAAEVAHQAEERREQALQQAAGCLHLWRHQRYLAAAYRTQDHAGCRD
jgi:hypothetical protein